MKRVITLILCFTALAVFAAWAPDAEAYNRYNDGCQGCHGAFTDGTSQKGTVFPSNNKHEMHRASSSMNTECDLCHSSSDNRNPWIGSSNGTRDNPGLGCSGCHDGSGLRAHHSSSGITTCVVCHGSSTPQPENTIPPYYGTADTNAALPCNPDARSNVNENWSIGDFLGLDNDGDGSYDSADSDCGPTCTDNDSDGYGNPGDTSCTNGAATDCNDSDPLVNPGATEVCGDGVDNDCTGGDAVCAPTCTDSDSDGFALEGGPCGPADCNDSNPAVNPGATEVCDGQDNDCSSSTADGSGEAWFGNACDGSDTDQCNEGTLQCAGGSQSCSDTTGDTVEVCDNQDNDCDGQIDENLTRETTCGLGECAGNTGTETCVSGVWGNDTCDPLAGAVAEICTDSLDNDCDGNVNDGCPQPTETACFDGQDNDDDGQTDCADSDCTNAAGASTSCGIGACASTGQMVCQNGALVDTCSEGNPSAETCDNMDNDCDGQVDEGIAPTSTTCGVGACEATGERICQNGSFVDTCQPSAPGTEGPFGDGTCSDSIDNDCDGATDTVDTNCENVIACVDGDGDGYGSPGHSSCPNGVANDCNDGNPAVNPGATEIPYNGMDDDCNGQTPDNDLDRDGFGNPSDCNDGNPAINPAASENCTDGVDNDCDGFIDANDPDCQGSSGPPSDHTDEEEGFMHKPGKERPYSNGCTDCHGPDLTGGTGPSCFSCHGREWGEDPTPENCTDGIDNDGDGAVDCADSDCTDDQECAQPDPEVCDDGLDNDGDGLVDCDDTPDCASDSACETNEEPGTHPFGGWTDAEEQHEDYVEENGPDECRACHGNDLEGSGDAPSCFSCHGAEWIDSDGDSVSDEKEKGHGRKDDHYDGNRDGKPDKGQKKVASFPTSKGNHYLTVESTSDIEEVESTDPAGDEVAGFNLPYGEMKFTISGIEPGGFATVTIYTDGEYVDTYYLFDEEGSAREFTYDSDSETGAAVGEFDVTLHLIDGGAGDSDGTVNGSISVTGAPASTAPGMELTSPSPGSAGGCAIVRDGESPSGLKGSFLILAIAGLWIAVRRRRKTGR